MQVEGFMPMDKEMKNFLSVTGSVFCLTEKKQCSQMREKDVVCLIINSLSSKHPASLWSTKGAAGTP